jgi:hypothetical protein
MGSVSCTGLYIRILRGATRKSAGSAAERSEPGAVPLFFRIILGFIMFMFALTMTGQWVSRAFPMVNNAVLSQNGQYRFVYTVYSFVPLVNGLGHAPGEVRLLDGNLQILDSRELPDITAVEDVAWDRDHVFFTYRDGEKTMRSQLDIEP